ncbi:MAG: hypothetical protein P8M58_01290 [Candidatus Marinimicrobia bacterium]|nr:hypothetical protein [Candidatus Neomarinimicrobiota bacterium]
MKNSNLIKFYLLLSILLTGCSTINIAKLSIVSTIPDLDLKDSSYVDIGTVVGEDKSIIIIFIPIGIPKADRAITNTLINNKIEFLTDVSIDNTSFWIPYIYGESKITVKGVGWRKSSNEKIPMLFADTITFKIGLTIKGTYIEQDANVVFFQVDGEQQIPQVAVSKQLDENKFLFKKSHIELVKIDNGKIIFDANTPKDKEPIIYDPKTGEIIKN